MIIPIRKGAVAALVLHSAALAGPAARREHAAEAAASYYTARLDDPKAVFVTRDRFGAVGDGIADDTAALQKAIDAVQETTGEGVVFVPAGRYRLSATLHVWPGIRVIGYGTRRPAFLLGDRTPGYQDPAQPRYMVFFAGRRPKDDAPPPDANPGTFYSALSNVDLEIGAGNAGAVGVRARYAQHCFTSHVEFRIGSGLAGIHEGGNVAEDVRFLGGDYGIWTGTPSPGWQLTLVDARFQGQRKAAIREAAAGLTLIRPQFRDVPTAIEIEAGRPDDLFVKDARFENVSGPALVVSLEGSPRTQVNLENVACRGVATFALFRESGHRLAAPGASYVVKAFSHGLHYADLGDRGETTTVFDAAPVATLPPPLPSDLAPLPPGDSWANARALGARGDGKTDDTAALQKAIDSNRTLYLPTGKYVVSDTLTLRPDSVLVGLHPSATQLVLPDRTPAFQGVGAPKPLLLVPKGGTTIVIGLGLYTNGINPRALSAKWMAGPRSMMNDVRFLGGHGTTGLDGKRENPYNNAHSADPDLARRWDSQYPSLWVTDGGGGTFFDLWTPSTFAAAGLLVSNTETSGRVYQMSSEHHVRHEVQLHNVANWELHALQTEAERGESGAALQLEIRDSRRITFSNLHVYRVISSDQPFPWAVKLTNSRDIRFRGMHCYSNSKVAYDWTLWDDGLGAGVKQREFAWLDVSGRAPAARGEHALPGARAGRRGRAPGGRFSQHSRRRRRPRRRLLLRRLALAADPSLVGGGAPPLDGRRRAASAGEPRLRHGRQPAGGVVRRQRHGLLAEGGDAGGEPTLLAAQAAVARPGLDRDPAHGRLAAAEGRTGRRSSRAPTTTWPPTAARSSRPPRASSTVLMSWGVKSSDLIRAFGLQRARPGERVYLTSEADVATWSALVGDDGGLSDPRLFVHQGGEGVAVDAEGNVFIAAGDVHVYDPAGTLVETIPVPGRPTQVVFGGPDGRTLFLPARDALYAVRTRVPREGGVRGRRGSRYNPGPG